MNEEFCKFFFIFLLFRPFRLTEPLIQGKIETTREGGDPIRVCDIIDKKKNGLALTAGEIKELVEGYTKGRIPDYQMSAFLMAVYFQGMTEEEVFDMTQVMLHSGEQISLDQIPGIKVDKHSTGGVGDKTTLVIGPLVAACGGKVSKLSGAGLGFTGGTKDKLEAIPGYQTSIPKERFYEIVNQVGVSVVGQNENIAPADKKIYALRDVTATVESIPLIASSIMSKKLASGCDKILLDVTVGSGAFMKDLEQARKLAQTMVDIGERGGVPTVAMLTDMDVPLGNAVGNLLEVKEAMDTLQGRGPADFTELCMEMSAQMLWMAELVKDHDEGRRRVERRISSGEAYEKFVEMIEAQGGSRSFLEKKENFQRAEIQESFVAREEGYLVKMDTKGCGNASMLLGAGRKKLGDTIDPDAGLVFCKKKGDYVQKGETIAKLYTNQSSLLPDAKRMLEASLFFGAQKPEKDPLILDWIGGTI